MKSKWKFKHIYAFFVCESLNIIFMKAQFQYNAWHHMISNVIWFNYCCRNQTMQRNVVNISTHCNKCCVYISPEWRRSDRHGWFIYLYFFRVKQHRSRRLPLLTLLIRPPSVPTYLRTGSTLWAWRQACSSLDSMRQPSRWQTPRI